MKQVYKFVIITLILLFSFILLGIVSYSIPSWRVARNIEFYSHQFNNHKNITYPIIKDTIYTHSLDYFTEALILNNMVSVKKENIFESVLLIPRYHSYEIKEQQRAWNQLHYAIYNRDKTPNLNYPRYWHGNSFLYRIFLTFMSYSEFIWLLYALTSLLLLYFFIKLKEYAGLQYVLAIALSLLMVNVYLMQFLIQFSSVLIIGLIIALLVMRNLRKEKTVLPLFFISGALAIYFDLLTVPLMTLGIPLIVYIILSDNLKSFGSQFLNVMYAALLWLLAYAMFWVFKWILVDIFTDFDIWENVSKTILYRSGVEDYSRINAINNNTMHIMFNLFWYILGVFGIIAVFFHKLSNYKKSVLLIIISFAPFVRYFVLANHAYLHHWFTYRALFLFIAGLLSAVLIIIDWEKFYLLFAKKIFAFKKASKNRFS
jgi:hypothetical protein